MPGPGRCRSRPLRTGGSPIRFVDGRDRQLLFLPGEFDLVIGADGLHSTPAARVRPEERYVSHLGYYAATWQLPDDLGLRAGSGSVGYHGAGDDHSAAFTRYERLIRPYAEGCQRGGDRTGPFLAPRTATGLRLRNVLLSRRSLMDRMLKEGQKVSSTVALPDYGTDAAAPVPDQRRASGTASPQGASPRP